MLCHRCSLLIWWQAYWSKITWVYSCWFKKRSVRQFKRTLLSLTFVVISNASKHKVYVKQNLCDIALYKIRQLSTTVHFNLDMEHEHVVKAQVFSTYSFSFCHFVRTLILRKEFYFFSREDLKEWMCRTNLT